MIGTQAEAELIYRRRKTGWGPTPKGWKKIGQGSYRDVYLAPSGVVYKLEKVNYFTEANVKEFENYRRIKSKRVRGWKVPKTQLFMVDSNPVIAMEFVDGEKHKDDCECFEHVDEYFAKIGLADSHCGQYVTHTSGKRYIVDMSF